MADVMKVSATGRDYRGAVDQLGDEPARQVFAAAFDALLRAEENLAYRELNGRLQVNEKGLTLTIYVGAAVDPPEIVVTVPPATDSELARSASQDAARVAADAELRKQIDRIGGSA